ncbi:MAG TPA: hypothetical protein VIJ14_04360, partial [Rhabdochlamydiaceae bacterium]
MKIIFSLLLSCCCYLGGAEKAVTYTFSGGRFGDNLLAYAHAKWIAYCYDIPLLYQPFPYSDQLALHENERLYCADTITPFKKQVTLGYGSEVDSRDPLPTLYTVPYFGEPAHERAINPGWAYVEMDWNDEGFRAVLKDMIKPKQDYPKMKLPRNRITIAAHVRRGGGADSPEAQLLEPMRFPPNQFYIDQIRRIGEIFRGRRLYCYIFTDDLNPQGIVETLRQGLRGVNVTLECRKAGNHHNSNVVEDFFALLQFDCIIRPCSNFSYMASR